MSGMTLHVLRYPRLPTFASSSSYDPKRNLATVRNRANLFRLKCARALASWWWLTRRARQPVINTRP